MVNDAAMCPSCHTTDPHMNSVLLAAGGDWRCGRCGQRWDALRLAKVAAYDRWVAERADSQL